MTELLLTVALLAGGTVGQDLQTMSGDVFSLPGLLQDGPAVLVFWNSWLPRGEEFLPMVQEIEVAAKQRGWAGAVVIFQDDDPQVLEKIGQGAFPRVLDRRGRLARQFRVTRAPVVVLVDPGGEVMARAGPEAAAVRELLQGVGDP